MCLKRTAVGAIGAVAMLAMTAPALSQVETAPDETFRVTNIYGLLNSSIGNLTNHSPTFFSFDISFVDNVTNKYYLADRSNMSIDILDLTMTPPALKQVNNF